MEEYYLEFIKQEDFEQHVLNTIKQYSETLKSINLKKFNSNIIDPIKLLFDKSVFNKTFEEIINYEIQRQRDKTNNNTIGYFHQNIFKYIKGCKVPNKGWDVIVKKGNTTLCIEMKNKHNTMNSSSMKHTYIKMQNAILQNYNDDFNCALVEIISKKSTNDKWVINIKDNIKTSNYRLKKMSIDKFYEYVTDDKLAFKKLCMQLPITINKILDKYMPKLLEEDTVFQELALIDKNIFKSLFKLAFPTYEGFDDF
ncbi:Eco47II family restriction endonuclease [Mycoplasma phocimorsus]|uniref:Eco47II family restriction endonuclease n=1 Tax=Mycoplasma phocimorsus TaxID=3045839 RepID=UPI0024C015B7|nr:Eco47II family restriction endonuclease [Mycoplasma phocimorsus]MDJ1646660.1 Eco47II family restriction endonuclease [Mycoplasma phocimorsus]